MSISLLPQRTLNSNQLVKENLSRNLKIKLVFTNHGFISRILWFWKFVRKRSGFALHCGPEWVLFWKILVLFHRFGCIGKCPKQGQDKVNARLVQGQGKGRERSRGSQGKVSIKTWVDSLIYVTGYISLSNID